MGTQQEKEDKEFYAAIATGAHRNAQNLSESVKKEFITALDNENPDGIITSSEAVNGFQKALDLLDKAQGLSIKQKENKNHICHLSESDIIKCDIAAREIVQEINTAYIADMVKELGLKIDDKAIKIGLIALHEGKKPKASEYEMPEGELPSSQSLVSNPKTKYSGFQLA